MHLMRSSLLLVDTLLFNYSLISFVIFFFIYAVSHNSCIYAEMWPNPRWTSEDPRQGSCANSDDEEFRVLAAPLLTTGSVSQAPPNPTDNSINFLELMTKPKTIIESLGAKDWGSSFADFFKLQSAKTSNPSNRFRSYTKPCIVLNLYLRHQTLFLINLSRFLACFSTNSQRFYGSFFLAGF